MRLRDVFTTHWVFTRLPYVDAPDGDTPMEAADLLDEYVTGAWKPFGYSATGERLLLRRKLRFTEKLALWRQPEPEPKPKSEPANTHQYGNTPLPTWDDDGELQALLAEGPRKDK